MSNKIVIVAGLPGAGKTTMLSEFAKRKDVKVVNLGTLVLEAGKAKKYVKERDEIRFLSNKKITELRSIAIKRICEMEGNIVIDSHISIGENGRYLPGFPIQTIDELKSISGLVYMDASTRDIMERRKSDLSRKREREDEKMIDNQRLINLSMLSIMSARLNVPMYVVVNRHGQIEKTVEEVRSRFDELFGGN